jgi:hypothetical protein
MEKQVAVSKDINGMVMTSDKNHIIVVRVANVARVPSVA